LHEFELFKKLGYTRFKIADQDHIADQKPPYPSLEGQYVDHQFERGSSGLFGNELPGEWLTARQAIWRYRVIFLGYYLFGDFGILKGLLRLPFFGRLCPAWYDTHAAT
jgi:hypothetical protein